MTTGRFRSQFCCNEVGQAVGSLAATPMEHPEPFAALWRVWLKLLRFPLVVKE